MVMMMEAGEIQKETTKAVRTMNDGTSAVQDGITRVNSAGEAFQDILQGVNGFSKQAQAVAEVVAGTEEQSASREEIRRAATSLAKMATDFQGSVAMFRL